VCSEALCIVENIIHPRLPVIGVEALSRCIATSHHTQVNAAVATAADDDDDTEPLLFGHQFDASQSGDHGELIPGDVACEQVHDSSTTESCIAPLPTVESSVNTEEAAGDVICLPNEETTMEVVETIASVRNDDNATSTVTGQELEASGLIVSESAATAFAISPTSTLSALSRTERDTARENEMSDEFSGGLTSVPALAAAVPESSESNVVKDQQLAESPQVAQLAQLSLRKRKYSTTSSVDGEDSGSEAGEIEVLRHSYTVVIFSQFHSIS